MVSPLVRLEACPSGFVSVTVRVPTVAASAAETFTVAWVLEFQVMELTVTPAPRVAASRSGNVEPPSNRFVPSVQIRCPIRAVQLGAGLPQWISFL
jgi:hypothetical protein